VSRGTKTWRPVTVWLAVTAGATTAAVAVPGAWTAASGSSDVVDLFVAACATALAASSAWLWAVTTVTVAGLLAGADSPRQGGATRRLVLAACGVAVVAGTAVPAAAAEGDGPELLAGLTLPDRAVAPAERRTPARPPAPATVVRTASPASDAYVVRPGDSLWSIAEARTSGGSVDERWRAIWQANRDVVGDDPDLILPGQALRLPETDHTTDHTTDTDTEDGAR
jgi:LysM repeat protein